MKIAILCPGFGWARRGTERVTEELAARLGPEFDVVVYGLRRRGCDDALWLERHGVSVRRVPGVPRTHALARFYSPWARRLGIYTWSAGDFEAMTFAVNLWWRLLWNPPDLILSFAGPYAGRVCRLVRAVRRTPFLHSAQGMAQGRLEMIHARQRPDRYLALSEPNLRWIEAQAPWLATRLVPNGVDCRRFEAEGPRAQLGLARPVIACVGAMDRVKRPDLTILAVERLIERRRAAGRPGASLLMIGEGELSGEMERLGRARLAERFLLLAGVPHEELPQYLRAADIFTLASPGEPFGIVFLEAMAAGLPVVAHRGEVQEWLMGEAGITCDCEDSAVYAAALEAALEGDFGDAPRQRAGQFDWDEIIQRYESVFAEFLPAASRKATEAAS